MIESSSPEKSCVQGFSERVGKLNAKPSEASLLTKIGRRAKDFFSSIPIFWLTHSSSTVWGVHVAAEHMAQKSFSGNLPSAGLSNTVAHLDKMGSRGLATALQYASKIERMQTTIVGIPLAARTVRKDVQALQPGESLVIPTYSSGHALLTEVKCTGINPQGKKIFSVTLHNTGEGLRHHHKKIVENKEKYQTTYELINVSEDSLCGERSQFFTKLLSATLFRSTDYIYTKVLASLDGELAPPRTDPKDEALWSHGQFGGSCTASCVLSYLRAHMTKEQFKQFRDSVRMEMFLKMYEKIQEGRASSHTINIALEIARKLQSRIPGLASALLAARQKIEGATPQTSVDLSPSMIGPEYKEKESSPFPDTSPAPELAPTPGLEEEEEEQTSDRAIDDLSRGFNSLKESGVYTTQRHGLVEKAVLQAHNMRTARLTPEGKKQLLQLAKDIEKFKGSRQILTKNQIYLYNAILSLVSNIADKNETKVPIEFYIERSSIYGKFANMSIEKGTISRNPIIDTIVRVLIHEAPKESKQIEFRAQQLALMPPSKRKDELRTIADGELAISIGRELLKNKDISATDVICALIENPNVKIDEQFPKKIEKEIEENSQISGALQKRLKDDWLRSTTAARTEQYDREFKHRFDQANEYTEIPWFEAHIFAHACAMTAATQEQYDLSKLPCNTALSQATRLWKIKGERQEALTALLLNQNVPLEDVQAFIQRKTPWDVAEVKDAASDAMKKRLQEKAATDLSLERFPEKKKAYQQQYDRLLDKAQKNEISWFSANLYADKCAREYLRKVEAGERPITDEEELPATEANQVQITTELIAQQDISLARMLQDLPLRKLGTNDKIIAAILARTKIDSKVQFKENQEQRFDLEFSQRFKHALEARLPIAEAIEYATDCARYCIDSYNSEIPLSETSAQDAISRANQHWRISKDREKILKELCANINNLSFREIETFVNSKILTDRERYVLEASLKNRLQNQSYELLHVSEEDEKKMYEDTYASSLEIAKRKGMSLFKAQVFADSCAREYIRSIREAIFLSETQRDPDGTMGTQPWVDQRTYFTKFVDEYQKKLMSSDQFIQCGRDIVTLHRHEALDQANLYWDMNQNKQRILQGLFNNKEISIDDINKFLDSKDILLPSEFQSASELLKSRFQNTYTSAFNPSSEELKKYQTQYSLFLQKAQSSQIPWFTAHIFADSCAREYMNALRERQPTPERYVEIYSEQYLKELVPNPSTQTPSWLQQPKQQTPIEQIARKKAQEQIAREEYF